jgi:tetratricopeptide (TPR) repeat protein
VEQTPGRYTFHDLLRAYATDLAHTIEPDQQRHTAIHGLLDHYLHTAMLAVTPLYPPLTPIPLSPARPDVSIEPIPGRPQALAWLANEYPILLAAVRHSADAGFDTHAWQLAAVLGEYAERRGHWHDQLTVQHIALTAAQRLSSRLGQASAHRALGRAYARLGPLSKALTHFHQALSLFGDLDENAGQAAVHLGLGGVCSLQGDHRNALGHARQALMLFRASGGLVGEAFALNNVGWCHVNLGEFEEAVTCCQQSLTVLKRCGTSGTAAAWHTLGYAHHRLGQYQQAIRCYRTALEISIRDETDRFLEARSLEDLGETHDAAGDPAAARHAWKCALHIFDELRHPHADRVRARLERLDQPECLPTTDIQPTPPA